MTIKLVGALLILISGSSIGWILGNQYIYRVKELQDLQIAINIFDTEISYGQNLLPIALRKTAKAITGLPCQLFDEAAQCLEKNGEKTFQEVWSDVLANYQKISCLDENDLKIIKEWGQLIGNSGLSDQQKINKLTVKRLEQAEKKASDLAERRVKPVRYAGVLLSLLVIILFY